jgi:hypothetical protein
MMSPYGDRRSPDAQQIAAFLDGELDGQPRLAPLRRWIQEWLLDHPEAGAAALAQRRLERLMHVTAAADPSEAEWDRMLTRLEQLPPPAARPAAAHRGVAGLVALLTTAAAVWAVVALWPRPPADERPAPVADTARATTAHPPAPRTVDKGQQSPAGKLSELEPFAVATADEIEIIRIAGADTRTLVVGHLPLLGTMVLAEEGEITLERAEPEVRMGEGRPPVLQWVRSSRED